MCILFFFLIFKLKIIIYKLLIKPFCGKDELEWVYNIYPTRYINIQRLSTGHCPVLYIHGRIASIYQTLNRMIPDIEKKS